MSSPFQLKQAIDRVGNDASTANIQALLRCVSTWIPVPLGAERTGKKCPNCSFKMHNKCKKCPYCYHVAVLLPPPPQSRLAYNDCCSCAQPHDVLVRMVCGCVYCSPCLARRQQKRNYCGMHKTTFQKKPDPI